MWGRRGRRRERRKRGGGGREGGRVRRSNRAVEGASSVRMGGGMCGLPSGLLTVSLGVTLTVHTTASCPYPHPHDPKPPSLRTWLFAPSAPTTNLISHITSYKVTLHYATLLYVMWCGVMWFDVMWCDLMWCDVIWCDVMSHHVTHCIVMLLFRCWQNIDMDLHDI